MIKLKLNIFKFNQGFDSFIKIARSNLRFQSPQIIKRVTKDSKYPKILEIFCQGLLLCFVDWKMWLALVFVTFSFFLSFFLSLFPCFLLLSPLWKALSSLFNLLWIPSTQSPTHPQTKNNIYSKLFIFKNTFLNIQIYFIVLYLVKYLLNKPILLNQPQSKVCQSCANSWYKVYVTFYMLPL